MHRDATRRRVERRPGLLARVVLLGLMTGVASAAVTARVPAVAQGPAVFGAPEAAVQRDGISLDEAIDRAQKRYRARVVRAEQSQSGGRVVYVLRLLSDEDGRVFTVRVDAETGAMR
jgi:uncharacterized membrane protein YkoI